MDLEEKDWIVALSQIKGVGPATIKRLKAFFETLTAIDSQDAGLMQTGLRENVIRRIRSELKDEYVARVKETLYRKNIRTWTMWCSDYPQALLHTYDPPVVLYGRFEGEAFERPQLSIVGTRTPSHYGRGCARRMASELAERGWGIVSGMAYGIDTEAHRGVLDAGGNTVAVLGCGVDVVYPRENRKLYEEIWRTGVILSEYPPGTRPQKGFFPRRNRIISGLTLGTVVVEAAKKSGSLITAHSALEQGRDVFAVPGSIRSPQSEGPHRLIQQGAKLVTSADDVVEEFPHIRPPSNVEDSTSV